MKMEKNEEKKGPREKSERAKIKRNGNHITWIEWNWFENRVFV